MLNQTVTCDECPNTAELVPALDDGLWLLNRYLVATQRLDFCGVFCEFCYLTRIAIDVDDWSSTPALVRYCKANNVVLVTPTLTRQQDDDAAAQEAYYGQ